MDEQNNQYLSLINNTIRGSYTYVSNIFIDDVTIIKNKLLEEKKDIEENIARLEFETSNVFRNILFFDKLYYFYQNQQIKHSNTINVIIKNYSQIKYIFDRLVYIYNRNCNNIITMKEKIHTIDISIDRYNSTINGYQKSY